MSDPTNGELALMIGNVESHLLDIKEQTTKTNGRVTALESWKNKIVGGLLIANIILVPTAITVITKMSLTINR